MIPPGLDSESTTGRADDAHVAVSTIRRTGRSRTCDQDVTPMRMSCSNPCLHTRLRRLRGGRHLGLRRERFGPWHIDLRIDVDLQIVRPMLSHGMFRC